MNRRLVSFGRAVPYLGIDHAGGEYVRRNLRVLQSLGFDLTVVAPLEMRNEQHRGEVDPPSTHVILPPPTAVRNRFAHRFSVRLLEIVPVRPPKRFGRACRDSSEVRSAVAGADVLELHWSEFAVLIPWLRRINPSALIVVVVFDVLSQRFRRMWLREPKGPRRIARCAVFRTVRFFETRQLARADVLLVLSTKDRQLLGELGLSHLVRVVGPPLAASLGELVTPLRLEHFQRHVPGAQTVLFTAAFSRLENHEAALWLLTHVWPIVLRAHPHAQCLLVGSSPREELYELARKSTNIKVTGYVPNFDEHYRAADLVVVPLHSGAGVKFKTLEAILRGVPVVSTTIGAEGIGDVSWFMAIEDEPEAFASAMCQVLRNPLVSSATARRTQAQAQLDYGIERFTKSIEAVYCGGTAH